MQITADMTHMTGTIDDSNNKPEYAFLNNNRAFCATFRPGFYIQANFGGLRNVTELQIQGFKLNSTNYRIQAFKLQFSLNNRSWYPYVHEDVGERFLVKDSGSARTVFRQTLSKPGVGQYVRLFPQSSFNANKQIMCIRFDMYGCSVVAPRISSKKSVMTHVNKDIKLTCSASGVKSMVIKWTNHSNTVSNVTAYKMKVKSELLIKPSFNELLKYKCTLNILLIRCIRVYICKSYYIFHPNLQSESKTKVIVNIGLPELIRDFVVVSKSKMGVSLSWKRPQLNDIHPSMVNYNLTCNISGFRRKVLSLKISRIFLPTSKIHHPYHCEIRLVKNNATNTFPFHFDQVPAVLSFTSLSIRPDVDIRLKILEIGADYAVLSLKSNISKKSYGRPDGFLINATMLEYGDRYQSWRKNLWNIWKDIKSIRNGFINSTIRLSGLKPWSKYRIEVVVVNTDKLMSNSTYVDVSTKEGIPSCGPSLSVKEGQLSTREVTLQVKEAEYGCRHGKVKKFELLILPINRTKSFSYKIWKSVLGINHVERLDPSTNYTFKCRISTLAGFGPFGDVLQIRMADDIPSKPDSLRWYTDNSKDIWIRWKKPYKFPGKIKKYEIKVTFSNFTSKQFSAKGNEYLFSFKFPASIVKHVKIRACITRITPGCSDWSDPIGVSVSVQNPYKKESALIIGFSVAFGLFAAFVVMCFIYFRRHYRSHSRHIKDDYQMDSMLHSREVPVFDDDLESERYVGIAESGDSSDTSTCNLAGTTHDPLPVDEFPGYINMVKQDDYKTLMEDYKNQMPVGKCYSWSVADLTENFNKNRYTNICAYDHSRIILKCEGSGRTLSDYINANSIYGYNKHEDGRYKYIATQGPLEDTIADFWKMVWQEGCSIIVMLTNLKENDKVKCCQYWPHESTKVYGKISVTLDKIDKTADYITRTFQLEQVDTKESRTVRQFHFIPWPDHGVPDYPTALLSLRRRVRHYYEEQKPIIVHCSAGIGRTGCFILIDAMLERIDREKTVDIFNYLNYMRTRRICMVQTSEQYVFAHTAVLEYLTFGNTETFVGELDKKFKELVRGNGMAEEFAVLERNRVSDVRPGNVSKVLLRQGIFVEAFRVDGFKQRDAFILTKAPTEDNIISFWKMVLEKQCHTIVMLNKCQEVSQEYFKYWPDVDGHNSYQDIAVLLNSEVANGNIMTRKIKVTTNKRRCEVNHFQFVDWPDTDIPNQRDYNNICTLMQAVEKSQHNLGNGPIIVHSGNDYGRSGTFIAIYNSTERLKVEQLIDVLQCVRAIRITQPLAVDNVNQYQFVYNMLRTYLEGFENYCNYKDYNVCRSPYTSTSSSFIS